VRQPALTPEQEVPALHPGDRLAKVVAQLCNTTFHALPVTDRDGSLLGVLSLEEVHRTSQAPPLVLLIVAADLMRGDVTPLRPGDRINRALELFVESDQLALPVVDGQPPGRLIGIVKRSDVSSTYLRYVHGAATP
jgi:CIC family chloride channel protein